MMSYAVMGNPIEHSLSPLIHQYFAKQFDLIFEYGKILVNAETFEQQVEAFFKAGGLGLNVTSPCKSQAFAISGEASARCVKAGAANTLWRQHDKIMADTTDGVGLLDDLRRYLSLEGQRLLILGAGGAVRSILEPLLEAAPAHVTLSNRTLSKAIELEQAFNRDELIEVVPLEALYQSYDIVIYAMASSEQILNLPPIIFQQTKLAYDLMYHPSGFTPFVTHVQSLGYPAVDGFGMLVCQAAASFKIWHGNMPDVSGLLNRRQMLFK